MNEQRGRVYLGRGKLEFLQSGDVSVAHRLNVVALQREQFLEGEDEFEVGGRRDVVVAQQLGVVLLGHEPDALVEVLAHDDRLSTHLLLQLNLLQELVGHHLQRVLRPRLRTHATHTARQGTTRLKGLEQLYTG